MPRKNAVDEAGLGPRVLELSQSGCPLHPGGCGYADVQRHIQQEAGVLLTPDQVREYVRGPRKKAPGEAAAQAAGWDRLADLDPLNDMVDMLIQEAFRRVDLDRGDETQRSGALGRLETVLGLKLKLLTAEAQLLKGAGGRVASGAARTPPLDPGEELRRAMEQAEDGQG